MEEEKNFKEKVEKFYNEHKAGIIMAGGATVITLIGLYGIKQYKKGFISGGVLGFHLTMNWFDKEFGTNLSDLYDEFSKLNPDKIVNVKI